jgi:hypothetical protein
MPWNEDEFNLRPKGGPLAEVGFIFKTYLSQSRLWSTRPGAGDSWDGAASVAKVGFEDETYLGQWPTLGPEVKFVPIPGHGRPAAGIAGPGTRRPQSGLAELGFVGETYLGQSWPLF